MGSQIRKAVVTKPASPKLIKMSEMKPFQVGIIRDPGGMYDGLVCIHLHNCVKPSVMTLCHRYSWTNPIPDCFEVERLESGTEITLTIG